MSRRRAGMLVAITIGMMAVAPGAAPAPRTYVAVEQSIAKGRSALKQPGSGNAAVAQGWNAYFDAIARDLAAYAAAKSEKEQVAALGTAVSDLVRAEGGQLGACRGSERIVGDLAPAARHARVGQPPAPRIGRGTAARVRCPERAHRDRWIEFVDRDLGTALRDFESSAGVVAQERGGSANLQRRLRFRRLESEITPLGTHAIAPVGAQ